MDDIVVVQVLEDDEDLPDDVEAWPALEDLEPEVAVRHLIEDWGLDEADARFHLALARGDIAGDARAVYEEEDLERGVEQGRRHSA